MSKFYVKSGPVRLVIDASDAKEAAVLAFQWSCDKQVEINVASPLEHVQEAERRGWQLHEEIWVNEKGFNRLDGDMFDTLDIVAVWQRASRPVCRKLSR